MSVDGLVSGMDTTALITQLVQAEAAPQAALKTRLKTTELAASAYRTVNTTFAAVRAAAENMLKAESWTPTKASSSATTVSVNATNGAQPGSLTFSVDRLATSHSLMVRQPATVWTSETSPYGATEIVVRDEADVALSPKIVVGGTGTLADAAAAINAATAFKLSASVVQLDTGEAALRVTSQETGAASKFSLTGPGTPTLSTIGVNAQISIGTDNPITVASTSNTFSSVLPGATFTVTAKSPDKVTVTIASDPDGVAAKVQSLVDAVNSANSTVRKYTNNAKGSTEALKGDYSVSQLAGQLLDAVSFAVGEDGSPAQVGFQLSKDPKDPKIIFDKAAFLAALKDKPDLAQRMVAGAPAGTAADGTPVAAVTGLAARVLSVAKTASDSATGSLVKLAEGQDSMIKDITDRIEAWDLRLAKRREMLTRQFSAMETALSSLKNQSTWLAGQINSLPTYG
jgi:flagellar hook-associated protein 2